jgi:hypothetical protein
VAHLAGGHLQWIAGEIFGQVQLAFVVLTDPRDVLIQVPQASCHEVTQDEPCRPGGYCHPTDLAGRRMQPFRDIT